MEKRALIAIVLSFLVLYIYEAYFLPPSSSKKAAESAKKGINKKKLAVPRKVAKPLEKLGGGVPLPVTTEVEKMPVENNDFKGEIIIPGGGVRNFYLKKYRTGVKKRSPPMELIDNTGSFFLSATVNGKRYAYFPFSVSRGVKFYILKYKNFSFAVTEEIKYKRKGYLLNTVVVYHNNLTEPVDLKLSFELFYRISGKSSRYHFKGAVVDLGGKLKKVTMKTLKKKGDMLFSGEIHWAGFADSYFLQALLMKSNNPVIRVHRYSNELMQMEITVYDKALDPGKCVGRKLGIYIGPKKLSVLKEVGNDLHIAVDFGIWGIVARPILALLNLFNIIFHNYGVSIILLTILIKILFYPLTLKSYRSMAKLKELQPVMEEIKKKYADDKEKMNQKLMELYKEYKVNPMGGCLPTLLQLPIFIALYYVLLKAIELRHAPFFLWMNDLSAPDNLVVFALGGFHLPIRILPLLMGATMYYQQKLTPSTMDKSQQAIFTFLPIIFTFLFYGLPSGLMLYWSTNNIISIYQQLRINKLLESEGDKESKKVKKFRKKIKK